VDYDFEKVFRLDNIYRISPNGKYNARPWSKGRDGLIIWKLEPPLPVLEAE